MTLEEVSNLSVEERVELLHMIRASFEPPISEEERTQKITAILEARRKAVLDGREVPVPWDDVKDSILTFRR